MTESIALWVRKTPVGDSPTSTRRSPHQNGEAKIVTWLDWGRVAGALGGGSEFLNAGGMLHIDGTHVVTSDVLEATSSRPSHLTAVLKSPCLLEDAVRGKNCAIRDGIVDEVSDELLFDRHWRRRCLNHSCLLFFGLDWFAWMQFGNGSDLSGSVGRCGWGSLSGLGGSTTASISIAHDRHSSAIIMVASSCDTDAANHRLELDERVSLVVQVRWTGLTIGAEVGVVADGALVAVAYDVRRLAATERTITENSVVSDPVGAMDALLGNWLIDRDKAMSWVNEVGIDDASGAEVPVRTVQTLVTDTMDVLETSQLRYSVELAANGKLTLSQPSHTALWRTFRPGWRRASARGSKGTLSTAGAKACLGLWPCLSLVWHRRQRS